MHTLTRPGRVSRRRGFALVLVLVAVAAIAEPHMAPKMAFPAMTEIANPPGK